MAAAVIFAVPVFYGWAHPHPAGESSFSDFRRDFLARMEVADRGPDPELWNSLFRGASIASDPREREELSRIAEHRFSRWLERRKDALVSSPGLGDFIRALREADLGLILEHDGAGRVLRDLKGDPLFKGPDGFAADEETRRRRVEESAEALFAAWEKEARAESQELLTSLPPGLAEKAAPVMALGIAESLLAARREFERVSRLAESRFIAARLADSFSLRKKSEDAGSGAVAPRLAAETEITLAAGLERLLSGLPRGLEDAPESIRPDPETWKEDFRREFEAGLEAWSRAEERFLASRLAWETRAGETFQQAEDSWRSAEEDFIRSRESWFSRMEEIERVGSRAWEESLASFRADYQLAMAELASAAEERMRGLRDEIGVCLDLHRECSALIEAAERNGRVLRDELERLLQGGSAPAGEEAAALRSEINFWVGENGVGPRNRRLLDQTLEMAAELEERIRAYGGEDAGPPLEREILRVRARLELLEEETRAARGLVAYAEDRSSRRPTEAETAEELRLREEDHSRADRALQAASELLSEGGRRVSASAERLRQALRSLEASEEHLRGARASYEETLSLYRSGDTQVLRDMLALCREELAAYRSDEAGRLLSWHLYCAASEGERRGVLREDALEAAELLALQDGQDQVSQLVRELLLLPFLSAPEGEALMARVAQGPSGGEAELRREVYRSYGRRAPAFLLMYAGRDARELRSLLEAVTENPGEAAAAMEEAIRNLNLPGYLAEALERWAAFPEDELHRTIADKALAVFVSPEELPFFGYPEELGEEIFAAEARAQRNRDMEKNLVRDIRILEEDRNEYLRVRVDPERRRMDDAARLRDQARRSYQEALEAFHRESEEHGRRKTALDAARSALGETRAALLQAREIADYAASGCEPGESSPRETLKKRQAAEERLRAALSALESFLPAAGLPPGDGIDPVYREAKEREAGFRSRLLHLLAVEETAAREGKILEEARWEAEKTAESMVRRVFHFVMPGENGTVQGLPFIPADGAAEPTGFSPEDEALFAREVEAYFSGSLEDISRRFSSDAALWMEALAGETDPSGLLRSFALAYYFDAVIQGDLETGNPPEIHVFLFSHPSWVKLLKDYINVGSLDNLVRDRTRDAYRSLTSDPRLRGLYGFYKMAMVTGNLVDIAVSIGKDVGDSVFAQVNDRAYSRQRYCQKWYRPWMHAEGNRIRALRKDISAAHLTGAEERDLLARSARGFSAASETLARVGGQLAGLGFSEIRSADDYLDALGRLAGQAPPSALARDVETLFPHLGDREKENVFAVTAVLRWYYEDAAEAARGEAELRAAGLLAERHSARERYRAIVEDPGASPAELREAMTALFGAGAFSEEKKSEFDIAVTRSLAADTIPGGGYKLRLLAGDLENLFAAKLSAIMETARLALEGEGEALENRRSQWARRLADLYRAGREGWRDGEGLLEDVRSRQWNDLTDAYRRSVDLWEAERELLDRSRHEWAVCGAEMTVQAGVEDLAGQLGLDRERLIAEVEGVRIPDILFSSGLSDKAAGIWNRSFLDSLGRTADLLAERSGERRSVSAAALPRIWRPSPLVGARAVAREIEEDILRGAAFVTAVEWGKAVREVREGAARRVADANRSVDKSLADTLRGAGYARSGNIFTRRAVIDETLFGGIERERQTIQGYRPFEAPDFDCGADLSRDSLTGKSGEYIAAMVRLARENIGKYLALIFGRDNTKDMDSLWRGAAGQLRESFEKAESSYRASAGYGRVENGVSVNRNADGLFAWHVGYAPVMKTNDPENVAEAGYGEMGRIMTLFFRNQARQMRGLASFDVTWYNKKLWDDDKNNDGRSDGFFGAPTLRSVANLAVGIAATATGNVWAAAALNLLDDAVFTAMDAAGGTVSLFSGFRDLGRQAALSAVALGVSDGFRILGGVAGNGGVLQNTLTKGTGMLASNAAGGALQAVRLGSGGPDFRWNVFREAVAGDGALASYTGGLLGTFLAGSVEGLGAARLGEVRSFADFVGGMAAAGTEYGLTGRTRLNIADFGIFGVSAGGRTLRGGMLELNLGGPGALFSLGSGGTDVSLGRILEAAAGAGAWKKNIQIQFADLRGGAEFAGDYEGSRSVGTALRALYSFGDAAGQVLLDRLLSGDMNLLVGFTQARGVTRGNEIHLAGLESRGEAGFLAGITLQHEAHRNGVPVGDLHPDGTRETDESNFAELRAGSLARLQMAAKIDGERPGFLASSPHLEFELHLHGEASRQGREELFLEYLRDAYRNDEDFYLPLVVTGGEYQNSPGHVNVPLLGEMTREEVARENRRRTEDAAARFLQDEAKSNGYAGDEEGYLASLGVSREKFLDGAEKEKDFIAKFKPAELQYVSLASSGCMLTAAMYCAETITGRNLSLPEVNRAVRDAGLFLNDSDLSPGKLAEVVRYLTGGEFRLELQTLKDGRPGAELLRAMEGAPETFLVHLRIGDEKDRKAYHSEALSSIDWGPGAATGDFSEIRGVHTANPWKGNNYTGRTWRSPGEIARWDIYKVVPNWTHYHMLYRERRNMLPLGGRQ